MVEVQPTAIYFYRADRGNRTVLRWKMKHSVSMQASIQRIKSHTLRKSCKQKKAINRQVTTTEPNECRYIPYPM